MATHSTLAMGAAKTCCNVGSTRPAMLASSWPMNAPRQTVPTTSQRYAGDAAMRGSGARSARSGLNRGTTAQRCFQGTRTRSTQVSRMALAKPTTAMTIRPTYIFSTWKTCQLVQIR